MIRFVKEHLRHPAAIVVRSGPWAGAAFRTAGAAAVLDRAAPIDMVGPLLRRLAAGSPPPLGAAA